MNLLRHWAVHLVLTVLAAEAAWAGGTGQNLLLVVNPNDENALRIANAYQIARNIPDRNILFIAPPTTAGFTNIAVATQTEMLTRYAAAIEQAIITRGLAGQIDYVGMVGQPTRYAIGGGQFQSMTYGLTQMTQFNAGITPTDASYVTTGMFRGSTPGIGTNDALHHSQTYSATYNNLGTRTSQYYMAGVIGYTGAFGNTPDQVISGLQRSSGADGAKPVGTIYFEENADIRSDTRESQWPAAQAALTARGIQYVQESNVSGGTPLNRNNVRGAVTGLAAMKLPNGSTYLPGSWADNLTSHGLNFSTASQTKATSFIAAGAAATSGAVIEPTADSKRFPTASIHLYIADGLTMGEAYARTVQRPDLLLLLGDVMAQPYADVPKVTLTTGPAQGQTVSGTVQLGASASLAGPTIATAISKMELYVDGMLKQTINASSGTFNLDSATLSDGGHELRVVAVNNAKAESAGLITRTVVVNNTGRSVAAASGVVSLDPTQSAPISVSSSAGNGQVSRIELRHLGRSVGQVAAASGTVQLNASQLAYGDNTIVPVAIFSDGAEVAGTPFTARRATPLNPGATPTPKGSRVAGIAAEYFVGHGGASIAASDFSGQADQTETLTTLIYPAMPTGVSLDRLAVRYRGRFEITAARAGECLFSLLNTNDSALLSIDGLPVVGYDNAEIGYNACDSSGRIFLGAGEHSFELLAANVETGAHDGLFRVEARFRGADGITQNMDSTFLYAAPEPATLTLLILGGTAMLHRGKK